MRHDGPAGPIYRQSVFLFEAGDDGVRLRMLARGLKDAATAHSLFADPSLVRSGVLELSDALGPGCAMEWRLDRDGYLGHIAPEACVITGRRGDQRRIESFTRIGPHAIEHAEYGYDMEGKLLFGGPPGQRYIWARAPDTPPPSGMNGGLAPRPGRGLLQLEPEGEQRRLVAGLAGEHHADGGPAGIHRQRQ
jgi:hypothetical protein